MTLKRVKLLKSISSYFIQSNLTTLFIQNSHLIIRELLIIHQIIFHSNPSLARYGRCGLCIDNTDKRSVYDEPS